MSKEINEILNEERTITFTFGSIAVIVTGLEHILIELKTAATNPYMLSDLIWLFTKSLKDKNGRQILTQCFGLPALINELLNYLV
jgi:hypothetical protein